MCKRTQAKKIRFKEGGYLALEIYISIEKKLGELIDIYYEKKGIKNENKKYFLCCGDIINHHKNQLIMEFEKDLDYLDVLVEDV